MLILQEIKTTVEIRMMNEHMQTIAYNSLAPEIASQKTIRSKVELNKSKKQSIILEITARDITALLASLNAYLRWIMVSRDIFNLQEGM